MILKNKTKELLSNNSYLKICYNVIKQEKRPLRAKEIVEIALRSGMMPYHLYGKNQQKTIHARISEHIKKHQNNSLFFRVSPGYFYIANPEEKDHFFLFKKFIFQKEKEKEKELIIYSNEIKNLFYNCINFNPDNNIRNMKYHAFSMVILSYEGCVLRDSQSLPNILISKILEEQLDLIDGHIINAIQVAHVEIKKMIKTNIEYEKFSFLGLLKRKIKKKNRLFFLFSCDISSYISNTIYHYNKNLKISEESTSEIIDKIKKPLYLKNILEKLIKNE